MIDVGACCPTIFTTGSLVNFLKNEVASDEQAEDAGENYVFLTAGACGPCRFGQYHESYEMALDGMGLRISACSCWRRTNWTRGRKGGGGLEINMPLSMGIVWAILFGDILGTWNI